MARRMLAEQWQLTDTQMQQQVVFVGDAPNDESMFEFSRTRWALPILPDTLST